MFAISALNSLMAPRALQISVLPPARLQLARSLGDLDHYTVRLNFTNTTAKPLAVTTFYQCLQLDLFRSRFSGAPISSSVFLSKVSLRAGPLWDDVRFVPPHKTIALDADFFPFDERILPGKYVVRGSFSFEKWPKKMGVPHSAQGKALPGGPYAIGPTTVELR